MANRYWVAGGSSTNWTATANTNWSATSGGTNNASVPTASDNAFFDANSGAVTVTVVASSVALSLDCTGFAGTLTGSTTLTLSGSVLLVSSMTLSGSVTFLMNSTTTGNIITCGSKSFNIITLNGAGGEWTLQDTLICSTLTLTAGSLITNNKTITLTTFSSSNSNIRSLSLGSSQITVISWSLSTSTNMALTAGSSTISCLNSVGLATFTGGGLTYNNLIFDSHQSKGSATISGSNTFNNLTIIQPTSFNNGNGLVRFNTGDTQICTTFNCSGSYGKLITLASTSNGSAWTISVATNPVRCNFVSLQDSTATGGATFNAAQSTNVSGNTGWNFVAGGSGMFNFL